MNQTNTMIMILLIWLIHCKIATPFQRNESVNKDLYENETEVVIAITEVEISGSYSLRSIFWNRVSSVRSKLNQNEGYLGGAIRREIFGNRAWTMTVWKNESALDQFVYSKEHEIAMKEGGPAVKKSKFYRGFVKWKELPISWERAEKLIDEEGRTE
ncbi:DUF3291 domain-containing protein [Leptospira levettii]|uniref:DUF3291 domain-containing protein n=1 Tax=Leptospira levettii TaxID=2023178 RepID=A0ABY2MM87_9LEPT|nr:DUF3291 domain-containing protein [Leptospira levettii]PKA26439.1 hypothetical protein CH381_10575 [Leptospira sp. mixed culture ATI2-C-A1]TGL69464.1 DUF3291 domain-containing protein [Leptospira levettii]TGM25683.1 DUF3291 domain-containing protein [Leptospira levettii]TGM75311.1 DUF3291 domain-containing protein [Leptospira levettii]TGM85914.1 DUF3291 domain-containing protein [Leptospira levettii]